MQKKEPQLYFFFRELGLQVVDFSERGLLIGYSILNSLLSFQTNVGVKTGKGAEELTFNQVKCIYNGLDEVISSFSSQDYYPILCELKKPVDTQLVQYNESSQSIGLSSPLLVEIFDRLTTRFSRNYEDRLRRDGMALYHLVNRKGIVYGPRNILTSDYRDLQDILARGVSR